MASGSSRSKSKSGKAKTKPGPAKSPEQTRHTSEPEKQAKKRKRQQRSTTPEQSDSSSSSSDPDDEEEDEEDEEDEDEDEEPPPSRKRVNRRTTTPVPEDHEQDERDVGQGGDLGRHEQDDTMHEDAEALRRRDLRAAPIAMSRKDYDRFFTEIQKSLGTKATTAIVPFWDAARFIPRAMGPFENMQHVLRIGLLLQDVDLDEQDALLPEELCRFPRNELKCTQESYSKVLRLCPMIVPMLPHLTKNPDHIKTVGAFLKNAQNSARSDDISRLRDHIIKYIYEAEGIQMPDSGLEKSRRGWNCEATARMLCPRDLRDEFDADPTSFCRDVRNGQRFVDHDDWPTLVYSATEYDTSKIEYGLLKSPFLVNCWKTIFQGPNSVRATSSKKGGRSTLAQAYEIKQVDEYSIIYTTILARFLLSSGTWDANDGPFMGVEFFKNLLYLFEDSVEWRKDTLAWWNARVFGCQAPGMQSSRVNPTRTGLSSVAKLKQQREAQRNQMRIQPPQRRASIAADN